MISALRSLDAPLALGFAASLAIHSAMFAAACWWTPGDAFPPSLEVRSGVGAEAGAEDLSDDAMLFGVVVTLIAPEDAPHPEPQGADDPQAQAIPTEALPPDPPVAEAAFVDEIECAAPRPPQFVATPAPTSPISAPSLALNQILEAIRAAIEQTADSFTHRASAAAGEMNPQPEGLDVSSRGLSESASETPGTRAPLSSHAEGVHDAAPDLNSAESARTRSLAGRSDASAAPEKSRASGGEESDGAVGDQAAGTPSPSASNRPPTYPAEARRLRQQGTVVLRLDVLADGGVAAVEIASSSGYPLLDDAAAQAARAWKFNAATINSIAVRCEATLPVRFALRR